MKKTLLVAAALVAMATASGASAQLAYPGSNWSNLTYNPSPIKGPEDNNVLLQGNLEQGIVWANVGGWNVNTYGAIGYSADRNGLAYNNKIVPTLGLKFQRPWDKGNLDVGIQVVHQYNFTGVPDGQSKSGTGVQVYVQYWTGWDLKR